MRLAGRFQPSHSRLCQSAEHSRVAGQRKHDLAEEYLAKTRVSPARHRSRAKGVSTRSAANASAKLSRHGIWGDRMKWLSAFKTNGEHWNMKLRGTRDRTVAQRRGPEIDPKHDRVTADMHPLPREVDLFGPLRYRPVDETSLDAAGDQEPIPSIAAPDYRAKAGADKSWRRQKLAQTWDLFWFHLFVVTLVG
jgi:hypothetical protein